MINTIRTVRDVDFSSNNTRANVVRRGTHKTVYGPQACTAVRSHSVSTANDDKPKNRRATGYDINFCFLPWPTFSRTSGQTDPALQLSSHVCVDATKIFTQHYIVLTFVYTLKSRSFSIDRCQSDRTERYLVFNTTRTRPSES